MEANSKTGNNESKTKSLNTLRKSQFSLSCNLEEETQMDTLTVEIYNLVVFDLEQCEYTIIIKFQDNIIVETWLRAITSTEVADDKIITAKGGMSYDPSDYENICQMADFPLVVTIQPKLPSTYENDEPSLHSSLATSNTNISQLSDKCDTNSCVIDILPALLNRETLWMKKRMEPNVTPSVLEAKSWDNLPLITLKIYVDRSSTNSVHHDFVDKANWMTVTVLAAYDVVISENEVSDYSVGTQIPIYSDEKFYTVKYGDGTKTLDHIESLNTYPHWENLRMKKNAFSMGDEKLVHDIEDITNEMSIDIRRSLTNERSNTLVWNSFHRSLLLENSEQHLWDHIRRYKWPFELAITTPSGTFSLMAHLDLFRLLYAGEKTVLSAVPLRWYDADEMLTRCGIQTVLTPLDSMASPETILKNVASVESSQLTVDNSTSDTNVPADFDEYCAWILVRVELRKPLKKVTIPPLISQTEINQMLKNIEKNELDHRKCTGRGQGRAWQSTVLSASEALLRVAYYNVADICAFSRQLSTTRTRVEILTSFWQDAALYVNDNFVVDNFIHHEDSYEEMLLLANIGLVKEAEAVLNGPEARELNPKLRAARHARQLQDVKHSSDLYLEYVSQNPNCGDGWRELSTCLKELDKDHAFVCLLKSLHLNIRHPLTLLSMGTLVYEEDPWAAEHFFLAILQLYPFWTLGCVTASVYYHKMESFEAARQVMVFVEKNRELGVCWNLGSPRSWESELGDWWDNTPLVPGTSVYHDAADLLLRLRAIPLAEVCIALALSEGDETAAYYHQAALCSRLKEEISNALCFIRSGLKKFGEVSYLRSLEVECLLKMKYREASADSAKLIGSNTNPFTTLIFASLFDSIKARPILTDLLKRQPNAYAWTAIADDWMERSRTAAEVDASDGKMAESYAVAYALQALKIDARAARAWALLAKLTRPKARREYCREMAEACGYCWRDKYIKSENSKQSFCYQLACLLQDCCCT